MTNCQRQAKEGVLDMTHLEARLDSIEARIDDLCGLLGEVLEAVSITEATTTYTQPELAFSPVPSMNLSLEGLWD